MYKRCGLSHSAIVDMSEVVALEEARDRGRRKGNLHGRIHFLNLYD